MNSPLYQLANSTPEREELNARARNVLSDLHECLHTGYNPEATDAIYKLNVIIHETESVNNIFHSLNREQIFKNILSMCCAACCVDDNFIPMGNCWNHYKGMQKFIEQHKTFLINDISPL